MLRKIKIFAWNEKGLQGSSRFLNKVLSYFSKWKSGKSEKRIESKLHRTIKGVTQDIKNFKYNLAVIKLRELFESFPEDVNKKAAEDFLRMFHVFCPHVTEEVWSKIGNKKLLSLNSWPVLDEKKIDLKFEKEDQLVQRVISDVNHIKELVGKKSVEVYLYVIPHELEMLKNNVAVLKKSTGASKVEVFAVNDKKKYDPENKAKKSKPGKPGIFVE